jgi:hypothetical protein
MMASTAMANPGTTVNQDSKAAGAAIRHLGSQVANLDREFTNPYASAATEELTGVPGVSIEVLGSELQDVGQTVARAYWASDRAVKCVASNDPVNPFKDSGCIVRYGGRTIAIAVKLTDDGSSIIILGTAHALDKVFNGLEKAFKAAAHDLGKDDPLAIIPILAYDLTGLTKEVVRLAAIGADNTVDAVATEGMNLISIPLGVTYDIVTLHWDRALVKSTNAIEDALNFLVNIPFEIFGDKRDLNLVDRFLSPLGLGIDKALGLDPETINKDDSPRS